MSPQAGPRARPVTSIPGTNGVSPRRPPRGRRWRARIARWLAPSDSAEPRVEHRPETGGTSRDAAVWQEISSRLASRVLLLAERVRPALDELESSEGSPERVGLLYEIDHGVARMRCLACDVQVLTSQNTDKTGAPAVSLLDAVRVAASGIEHYDRLHMGPIADRAIRGHAADDVASLLAALLDNATRCSQAPSLIDTRSSSDGSLLFRIKDNGPGVDPAWAEKLNRMFVGPVPPMNVVNARRTGFAVAHRLARKHGLGVALVCRRAAEAGPGQEGRSGTVAMVTVPPHLLCDVPDRPYAPTSFADELVAFASTAPGAMPPDAAGRGYRPASPSTRGRSEGTAT